MRISYALMGCRISVIVCTGNYLKPDLAHIPLNISLGINAVKMIGKPGKKQEECWSPFRLDGQRYNLINLPKPVVQVCGEARRGHLRPDQYNPWQSLLTSRSHR